MERKRGLVLEGGAMRGIFTAGALDYLLEKEDEFDYVVGVSAGAGNAVNFIAKQPGRTRKIITHENAESYYGFNQFRESKKLLNLETFVKEYALNEIPYDFDTYFSSNIDCEGVVVCCETGKTVYKGNFKDKDTFFKYNMASCAVPFICEPIEIDGNHYLDGSIVDSIPVERAITKGCDKILVILTKPEGSSPTDYSKMKNMINLCYRKYPKLCDALANRKKNYDKQIALLNKLEKEGKAFVVRPSLQMIRHFEADNNKLMAFYNYGYELMKEHYQDYIDFMEK